MPHMDGTSAMRILLHEQPPPNGPSVVALTASAMSGDEEEALKSGFQVSVLSDGSVLALTPFL